MRKVLRSYVDLPDGQVHLLGVAGSDPAIVFLHQTASAASTYEPLLRRLRLPNRLIALDTPGFGGSFDPRGWPSMAKYAVWVMAALDRLKVRRFHLFGHHTGASLATEIAFRHPKRARSVMMLGPVPMTRAERIAFRAGYDKPIAPRPDGMHLVENWNYAFNNNPGCDLALIHEEVVNMARAWRGRPQAYRAVSFHDLMARLKRLTCPVLLLTSPGDFFLPVFEKVRALRPDASVARVGGANFPPQTHSASVAAAIKTFVRRVDGSR